MKDFALNAVLFALGIAIVPAAIAGVIWAWQPFRLMIAEYTVEQQELAGEAELRRAEQNRQIAIQEARANAESAEFLAQAEIRRAEGVAEANRIIAEGLGGPEGYLHYLWIQALPDGKVIYVPTEAGMPVTEAGRAVQ